jgi:hypothetical protein
MAISVTHATVATSADDPSKEINKGEWNEAHSISMASQRVLGRTTSGTGDAEELKGMWVEVSRTTVSSPVVSVTFTGIDSSSDEWTVLIVGAVLESDSQQLALQVSTDGGSTWKGTGGDYYTVTILSDYVNTANGDGYAFSYVSNNQSYIRLHIEASNATGATINGKVTIINPSAAVKCQILADMLSLEPTTYYPAHTIVHSAVQHDSDVDAVKFLFAGDDDITSGTFVLYKRLK